jgi:hypothetical protein
MTAATSDRDGQRQPSELVPYTGASGLTYYKNTMVMMQPAGVILPAAQGAGASMSTFLGVMRNRVDVNSSGLSNAIMEVWKKGEFTFAAQGTGATADIGANAWIIDDQTVGMSVAPPMLKAGEIVGLPSTSEYRVRIDNAINQTYNSGLSSAGGWVPPIN